MTKYEFELYVKKSNEQMTIYPSYLPFWAYTWGLHSKEADEVLHSMNITPIYVDGIMNYCDSKCIHRELLS